MRIARLVVVLFATACSSQEVVIGEPPFTLSGNIEPRGKVGVLFAIDSAPSMGDMQNILASSVPAFIDRLVSPRCVATSAMTCQADADCTALGSGARCDLQIGTCFLPGDGQNCTTIPNTSPEFAAVSDLHLAIVSSSLGGGGSPTCALMAPASTRTIMASS
jgi:hypothetical protein